MHINPINLSPTILAPYKILCNIMLYQQLSQVCKLHNITFYIFNYDNNTRLAIKSVDILNKITFNTININIECIKCYGFYIRFGIYELTIYYNKHTYNYEIIIHIPNIGIIKYCPYYQIITVTSLKADNKFELILYGTYDTLERIIFDVYQVIQKFKHKRILNKYSKR